MRSEQNRSGEELYDYKIEVGMGLIPHQRHVVAAARWLQSSICVYNGFNVPVPKVEGKARARDTRCGISFYEVKCEQR